MNVVRIQLGGLKASGQPRPLATEAVDRLAASIKAVGLLQPITVRPCSIMDGGLAAKGHQIIAGHHRVAACRALGWAEIDAIVVDAAEHLQAELMEIDENLCRAELTASQRAQAIKRRKQIWEALHPTRQRFDSVYEALGMDGEPGGQSFPTRNDDGTFIKGEPKEKAFAASTAAVSGESKRAINQHLARADALGDDLERIAGTSLDKGVELDALKAMPEPERKELIDRAVAGEKVSARASQKSDEPEPEKPKQSSVASLAIYLHRVAREIPSAMGCRSVDALERLLGSAVCPDDDWKALEASLAEFSAVLDVIGDRVFSGSAA